MTPWISWVEMNLRTGCNELIRELDYFGESVLGQVRG